MLTFEDFAQNFDGKPVPDALVKLFEFQNETEFASYSEGDEDDEGTEYSAEYRNWLKKHFNLDAIDDEDIILAPVIEKYQRRFDDWVRRFLR